MPVILRGRFEPLGLDYEVQGTSPLGAVTEWTALMQELEQGRGAAKDEKPSEKAAADFKVVPDPAQPEPPAAKEEKKPNPPLPKADPAERAAPKKREEPKKATSKPAPMSKNGTLCCECQKPLTQPEERASRLFVSRPLCKACLQSI